MSEFAPFARCELSCPVLSTERPQFDEHFAVLCAGMNVPPTPERREAYWRGLSHMSVTSWARVVDRAIGEQGPEKLPTVPGLWRLYHQMRAAPPIRPHTPQPETRSEWIARLGGAHLCAFLMRREGASRDSLARLVQTKTRLVEAFLLIDPVDRLSDEDMRAQLTTAYARDFAPMDDAEKAEFLDNYAQTGRL